MSLEVALETAQAVLTAARNEAERLGLDMSIAVVDEGGNLKAFIRMDGAELAGVDLARDKAYTALTNSIPTHELAKLTAPGEPLYGIHACAGGRYVIFGAGIPLWRGGRIVGAVGVSGGGVGQDVACAEAGVAAWEAVV